MRNRSAAVALSLLAGSGAPGADADSMSPGDMAAVMQMDDTARFGQLMIDQLEYRGAGGDGDARAAWDAQAYYGGDYDKVWMKTEGSWRSRGAVPGVQEASSELLWDRVVSPWWSLQLGARQDLGPGQARTWAAAGIQGLAPQWLQTEATIYLSDAGHGAARFKAQYELLLTQRLVLQPFFEANVYARGNERQRLGSGLADVELSMRLRYELRREWAPYLGLVWLRRVGSTAELVHAAGGDAGELQIAAGLHAWL